MSHSLVMCRTDWTKTYRPRLARKSEALRGHTPIDLTAVLIILDSLRPNLRAVVGALFLQRW